MNTEPKHGGRFLRFEVLVNTSENETTMFKRIFEAINGTENQSLVTVNIYDPSPESVAAWKELRRLMSEENKSCLSG